MNCLQIDVIVSFQHSAKLNTTHLAHVFLMLIQIIQNPFSRPTSMCTITKYTYIVITVPASPPASNIKNPGTGRHIHPQHCRDGQCRTNVCKVTHGFQGMSLFISSMWYMDAHCSGTAYEQILQDKVDMAFCVPGENEDWGFTSMLIFMDMLSMFWHDPSE